MQQDVSVGQREKGVYTHTRGEGEQLRKKQKRVKEKMTREKNRALSQE